MLQNQKKFSEVLTQVVEISRECKIDTEKTEHLRENIDNMYLPVAVVGEFSAGKSTMLNKFIGKNVLATNIKPETAVPAELYYADSEYSEGITKAGEVVRLQDVSGEEKEFQYVRRYINSENLRNIYPLILIDMPGFDSPIKNHSEAVNGYLGKAAHFIVLTSVQSGTISLSMKRQLENIIQFGKGLTFFLSKTDLRSDHENNEVKAQLEKEIAAVLGTRQQVFKINHDDTKVFETMVKDINPEELFKTVFIDLLRIRLDEVKTSINTKRASLKNDAKKNEYAIRELEDACKNLEKKRDKLIAEKKEYTYFDESERISSRVGQDLSNNIDHLTNIALSGGSDALKMEVEDIIQNSFIAKTSEILEKINLDFSQLLSNELKGLDTLFDSLNASGFIQSMQKNAEKWLYIANDKIGSALAPSSRNGTLLGYTMLTGIAAAATSVIGPVLEVIIIALPSIINFIFDQIKEYQRKEVLRNNILNQIPVIKRKVRIETAGILKEQSEIMIQKISESFNVQLEEKKREIESVQKELSENNDIAEYIAVLEKNYNKITELEREIG